MRSGSREIPQLSVNAGSIIIGNLVEHQHATSLITEPYYALVCTITVRYHA